MYRLKFIAPALILAGGLIATSAVSQGTVAISKKENGAKCTVCHTRGKELNDVGKCYKEKQSLTACPAPPPPAPAK